VVASTAVTAGLFVLAGVVVGGLVTGAVNYAFECRRVRIAGRVAVRLLTAELSIAAASAEWRLDQGAWSPWNFESAHRSWNEYRHEASRVLSTREWDSVAVGFYAVEIIERRFSNKAVAAKLDAEDRGALNSAFKSFLAGANTLRRRQGLEEIESGEPTLPS
jgi:hypothetical protein